MIISIRRNGTVIGEWNEKEIRLLYQEGHLLISDLYWKAGMTEWAELARMMEPTLSKKQPGVIAVQFALALAVGTILCLSTEALNLFPVSATGHQPSPLPLTNKQTSDNDFLILSIGQSPSSSQASAPIDYDKILKDYLARYNTGLLEHHSKYLDCRNKLQALGEYPSVITSAEDLQKRMDLVLEALKRSGETEDYVKGADADYVHYLKAMNAPADVITRSSADFHSQSDAATLLPHFHSDGILMVSYLNLYSFLKKNYGLWKIENKAVVFHGSDDDPGKTAEATNLAKDVSEAESDNLSFIAKP